MSEPNQELDTSHVEGRTTQEIKAGPSARWGLVPFAVLCGGALSVLALGLGWLFGVPIWTFARFNVKDVVWGILATVPMATVILAFDRFPIGPFHRVKHFSETRIRPLFRGCRLWQLLVIALSAGVGEELLCRGFLQSGLQAWLAGALGNEPAMWIALVVVSVAFGMAHSWTREYAACCTVLGFYLGGVYLVTDNLIAPIIVHTLYDFVIMVDLTRDRRSTGLDLQ